MKKLAIVNHNLGSGGAEKLIYDIALELKKRDVNFSVILLTSHNCIYGKKLLEKGVDVIYLSHRWDIYSPKNIFRLIKVLKGYDVIHTHIYSAQLWTAFSSYFLPAKRYITTEHNTNNNRRGKSIFKYLDRWMYSRYDEIVSISQATQKNLIDWLGIKKIENYRIITNAIKLEKFYSIKGIDKSFLNENFKVDDILISMVGRFSQQKDHNTLLEALSYLPPNIKLLLLGSGENKEAMKKCEELFLSDRVYFLGYCSNASEIVKSCKINILSSNWEGFGLAALESMAMGVPTIGSDVSGLKEVLENGGLIFKKGDAFQLSNLIKKLISNNSFYIEVSNRCILKSKEYSFEKMFNNYLQVYGVE